MAPHKRLLDGDEDEDGSDAALSNPSAHRPNKSQNVMGDGVKTPMSTSDGTKARTAEEASFNGHTLVVVVGGQER
ncbi:hypothetical protein AURDEDRAFT_111381 [Auricularia subglabra TFB-10046 SS5]|nr:hypothetical protein AURDEDRAFT_111381 [Auricularia subglabra TFB-10046 SS5]